MNTTSFARMVLFAALLLGGGPRALAQLPAAITAEGFEASEYHPEPNHTQLKWQIIAARMAPQTSDRNQMLLSGVQLKMFGKTGGLDLAVDTPECLFDYTRHIASSPGKLAVLVADGRFTIEGEGFLWQQTVQTNSTLIISNHVRATVQRETNVPAATPMVITAQQFEFDSEQRRAVFRKDVRAEDAEIGLRCGVLTATTAPETGTLNELTVEQQVTVVGKREPLVASADRAVYSPASEAMTLTGRVTWRTDANEGRAERVTMQRGSKAFEASGNVAVKLPRGSLGFGGLLPGEANATNANASGFVDVSAQHLLVSSNLTLVVGEVRVRDAASHLACDRIRVQSREGDQTAVAEGRVVVCHGSEDQCLHAERASYTKSTGAVLFTGEPTWKLSSSDGRADQVTLTEDGGIHALGNVATRLRLGAQSNSFLNLMPAAAQTSPTGMVFETSCRELTANRQQVTLRGGVEVHQAPITGHQPRLRCEILALHFRTNSPHVERMQAEEQVRFEQGIAGLTNGPNAFRQITADRLTTVCDPDTGALATLVAEGKVRAEEPEGLAQGDRASYTAATEILELTGGPSLSTRDATLTGKERIIWNRKNNKVYATGIYVNTGQTNLLDRIRERP